MGVSVGVSVGAGAVGVGVDVGDIVGVGATNPLHTLIKSRRGVFGHPFTVAGWRYARKEKVPELKKLPILASITDAGLLSSGSLVAAQLDPSHQ